MKKVGKILLVATAATLVISAAAFAGCTDTEESAKTYTQEFTNVTATEGDNREITSNVTISCPVNSDNVKYGYPGFASFVDSVSVKGTLVVENDAYTFTWKVQCGSLENAMGYFAPEFEWKGSVTASTDTTVTLGAAQSAKCTIVSGGQFATNDEMVGMFGTNGLVVTNETESCQYMMVTYGSALLEMFSAGTYTVSGTSLVSYTVA